MGKILGVGEGALHWNWVQNHTHQKHTKVETKAPTTKKN